VLKVQHRSPISCFRRFYPWKSFPPPPPPSAPRLRIH
jgi:hypothetical protein